MALYKIKNFVLLVTFLFPILTNSQKLNSAIHFESELNWSQIQAKAKAENKYIFMDCYTTWCGPCKWMDKYIFSQSEVGNYFNDHFISVSVQMNKTSVDQPRVKEWYLNTAFFEKMYGVEDYPTFLFFAPDGHIVHRIVGTISNNKDFINKAADALTDSGQYYSKISGWQSFESDSAALHEFFKIAVRAADQSNIKRIGKAYIESLKTILTEDNLNMIKGFELLNASNDKSFKYLLDHGQQVNKLMNSEDYVQRLLSPIIYKEELLSPWSKGLKVLDWKDIVLRLKKVYPELGIKLVNIQELQFRKLIETDIKQIIYSPNAKAADWRKINKELKLKYPGYDFNQIFLEVKVAYCYKKKQWDQSSKTAYSLMKMYGTRINPHDMNNLAYQYVFEHCRKRKILAEAIKWMRIANTNEPNRVERLDTYANLLYKAGRYADALYWQMQAVKLANGVSPFFVSPDERIAVEQVLEKMQKRQPTWVVEGQPNSNK